MRSALRVWFQQSSIESDQEQQHLDAKSTGCASDNNSRSSADAASQQLRLQQHLQQRAPAAFSQADSSRAWASATAAQSPESSNSASLTPKSPSPQPATPTDAVFALGRNLPPSSKPIPIATPPPTRDPTDSLSPPDADLHAPGAAAAAPAVRTATTAQPWSIPPFPASSSAASYPERNPFLTQDDIDLVDADVAEVADMTAGGMMEQPGSLGRRHRQDSFVSAGPKPIKMTQASHEQGTRQRRESLAGSLMNTASNMSWGGVSFGSFVRDDIAMQGTSPSFGPYQSPSFHSSSYLPKLEANFMKDFRCCEIPIANLHDLLQHYEEAHAGESTRPDQNHFNQYLPLGGFQNAPPRPRTEAGAAEPAMMQNQSTQPSISHMDRQGRPNVGMSSSGLQMRQQQSPIPAADARRAAAHAAAHLSDEMDAVGDMEMDEAVGPMELDDGGPRPPQRPMHPDTSSFFGQNSRPQLGLNSAGPFSQALRTSQPPTPAAASFGLQHNPTVSSVNTPTLATQAQQQAAAKQQAQLQQSSQSPFAPDHGASALADADEAMLMTAFSQNSGLDPDMSDMGGMDMFGAVASNYCIDDPAKALYSPNGIFASNTPAARNIQAQLAQMGIDQNQLNPADRAALVQQLGQMMMPEEHKPFRCPVIGCEKAYKNQNGLKYHKAHGHTTQRLHENGDGTFSIVNPETSTPYPGTLGMEKEKPFSCEVCGKRYKNLNGLKYHKSHSLSCNPELQLQALARGLKNIGEDQAMT